MLSLLAHQDLRPVMGMELFNWVAAAGFITLLVLLPIRVIAGIAAKVFERRVAVAARVEAERDVHAKMIREWLDSRRGR